MSVKDTPTVHQARRFAGMPIALIVVGGLLAVLVLSGIGLFVNLNTAQKTGTDKEAALTAQYTVAQTELSTLIGTVKDSLGVADIKSERIDEILTNAIAGRGYTSGGGSVDAQLVIQAVQEAYPDLTPLNSYDQVIAAIQSGRQSFGDQQNKLQDMIRDFDAWRKGGLIHRQVVAWAGIPDDTLVATIGQDTVTGQAALDRMRKLVLAEGTTDAYESGEIGSMVPGTDD